MNPWDKREDEEPEQHAAFCSYLAGKPGMRSTRKASRRCGVDVARLDLWCFQYEWAKRAAAYDEHHAHALATKPVDKIDVSSERVLQELAVLAFAQITDVAQWDQDEVTLTESDDVPAWVRGAIKSVKITQSEFGPERSVQLHDKIGALDKLGRHFKLWG